MYLLAETPLLDRRDDTSESPNERFVIGELFIFLEEKSEDSSTKGTSNAELSVGDSSIAGVASTTSGVGAGGGRWLGGGGGAGVGA